MRERERARERAQSIGGKKERTREEKIEQRKKF